MDSFFGWIWRTSSRVSVVTRRQFFKLMVAMKMLICSHIPRKLWMSSTYLQVYCLFWHFLALITEKSRKKDAAVLKLCSSLGFLSWAAGKVVQHMNNVTEKCLWARECIFAKPKRGHYLCFLLRCEVESGDAIIIHKQCKEVSSILSISFLWPRFFCRRREMKDIFFFLFPCCTIKPIFSDS